MTRAELRKICNSLNPGGQTRLSEMVGWTARTMRNKLAGNTQITRSDELAIRKAMEEHAGEAASRNDSGED